MKPYQFLTLFLFIVLLSSCDKNKDPGEVCILTSIEESDGYKTVIEYNDDRVTKISEKGPNTASTHTYTYNADGFVSTIFLEQPDGDDFETTLHHSGDVLDSAISMVLHNDGSTALWTRVVYHYRDGMISGYQINSDQDSVVWITEFGDVDAHGNYREQKRFDGNDGNKLIRQWVYAYDDKPNTTRTFAHHYPLNANDLAPANTVSETQLSTQGGIISKRTSTYEYNEESVKSASVSYERSGGSYNQNYKVEYGYTCRDVD